MRVGIASGYVERDADDRPIRFYPPTQVKPRVSCGVIVAAFMIGDCITEIANREGLAISVVEQIIRESMLSHDR